MILPDLEGKHILITGASRGIGQEIAKEFAKQKSHVVFNYRSNEQAAKDFEKELLSLGASNASALNFDINDYENMYKVIDEHTKEHGVISGLINNAGISKDQLSLRVKPEDIEQTLTTNLKSTMVLTNHLTRQFLKASDVSIVNMSSIVGLMGNKAQTVYAASKAGLIGFTKSYAKELGAKNIRANAICPGFIETQMTAELKEDTKKKYTEAIALGHYGSCLDVANLVLFLTSRASSYITGEVISQFFYLYP